MEAQTKKAKIVYDEIDVVITKLGTVLKILYICVVNLIHFLSFYMLLNL